MNSNDKMLWIHLGIISLVSASENNGKKCNSVNPAETNDEDIIWIYGRSQVTVYNRSTSEKGLFTPSISVNTVMKLVTQLSLKSMETN